MSNKLLISAVVLASAIMATACDKTPSGESDRSGSARSEADEPSKRQRTEPQKHSGQIPSQVASGETEQQTKPSQVASGETEQQTKPSQVASGETESKPSKGQRAKAGEDRNTENNGLGEQAQ